jgi:hypothetical protein
MSPIPLLPQLTPAPYQIPLTDPKTGVISEAWQQYYINLERVIFGVWTEVPYDAANFNTDDPLITWNVPAGSVNLLQVFQMGTFAIVSFAITNTTVSADVLRLEITIPTLRQKVNTVVKLYNNLCEVNLSGVGFEVGSANVQNLTPAVSAPAVISIFRLSTALFPTASPGIWVSGTVVFECQSVVTP